MRLLAVPPEMAVELPRYVWAHIEKAVEGIALSDAASVHFDVLSGHAVLWIAVDDANEIVGAGVTQIQEHRGNRICVILAWGADNQKQCQPLLQVIEDHAKAEECAAVWLYGREGWKRALPDFKLKAVIMEKAL
jgi:hypothetical protein